METMFLKLGGSLITFKSRPYRADTRTINRLSKEISAALRKRPMRLVIGHGGGSFAHTPAHKYKIHKGIRDKKSIAGFALTQDAAARLDRIIVSSLLNAGVNAVSFPPSSWIISRGGETEMAFPYPIKTAIDKGMVPVVYGDPILDLQTGSSIYSTEKVLSYLAMELSVDRVIMATRVDMVYTGDPQKKRNVEPIPEITSGNFWEIQPLLSGASERDVTGGMSHKVDSLFKLSASGVRCEIAGGMVKGNIKNALLGKTHKSTTVGRRPAKA